jgi:hypothetical protein
MNFVNLIEHLPREVIQVIVPNNLRLMLYQTSKCTQNILKENRIKIPIRIKSYSKKYLDKILKIMPEKYTIYKINMFNYGLYEMLNLASEKYKISEISINKQYMPYLNFIELTNFIKNNTTSLIKFKYDGEKLEQDIFKNNCDFHLSANMFENIIEELSKCEKINEISFDKTFTFTYPNENLISIVQKLSNCKDLRLLEFSIYLPKSSTSIDYNNTIEEIQLILPYCKLILNIDKYDSRLKNRRQEGSEKIILLIDDH